MRAQCSYNGCVALNGLKTFGENTASIRSRRVARVASHQRRVFFFLVVGKPSVCEIFIKGVQMRTNNL